MPGLYSAAGLPKVWPSATRQTQDNWPRKYDKQPNIRHASGQPSL